MLRPFYSPTVVKGDEIVSGSVDVESRTVRQTSCHHFSRPGRGGVEWKVALFFHSCLVTTSG